MENSEEIVRVPKGTRLVDTVFEYQGVKYSLHALTQHLGIKYVSVYYKIKTQPERDIADILTECLQTPACWLGARHDNLAKIRRKYNKYIEVKENELRHTDS